jgi:hypothetical protein
MSFGSSYAKLTRYNNTLQDQANLPQRRCVKLIIPLNAVRCKPQTFKNLTPQFYAFEVRVGSTHLPLTIL